MSGPGPQMVADWALQRKSAPAAVLQKSVRSDQVSTAQSPVHLLVCQPSFFCITFQGLVYKWQPRSSERDNIHGQSVVLRCRGSLTSFLTREEQILYIRILRAQSCSCVVRGVEVDAQAGP